jgi:hypothetical protein
MIFRAALVLVALTLLGGVAMPAARSRIPGTGIEMAVPPGMVPSREFVGFADPAKGSAMLVAELPIGSDELPAFLAAISDDVLAAQGLSFIHRTTIPGGIPGNLLINAREFSHGIPFERWIYIAPGEHGLAMITVQLPQQFATETTESELCISLASVRVTTETAISASNPASLDALPFTFDGGAQFNLHSVLAGNTVVLKSSEAGQRTKAILLISKSLEVGNQDRLEMSTHALEQLEGVDRIDVDGNFTEVAVGDLNGIEQTAHCVEKETGQPCFAYQMMVFDIGARYRVLGLTHADHAEDYLPEFRRIARSLRPR